MKRKFLILSAALLAVCGAVLLQSCSSEYEYYDATEEYGYYTEEEIAAIKALGDMYNLNLIVDKNYYGLKNSLTEMERSIIEVLNFEGEYEFANLNYDDENRAHYATMMKKETDHNRVKTRSSESSLPIQGSVYGIGGDSTPCKLSISWRYNTKRGNVVYYTTEYPYCLSLEGYSTIEDYSAKFTNSSISIKNTIYFYRKGVYISSFLIHGVYSTSSNSITATKVHEKW